MHKTVPAGCWGNLYIANIPFEVEEVRCHTGYTQGLRVDVVLDHRHHTNPTQILRSRHRRAEREYLRMLDSNEGRLHGSLHLAAGSQISPYPRNYSIKTYYLNSAPKGDEINIIAAGPNKISKMDGKMRSPMGKTILIGARCASSSAICRRRTRI